jgi:hypothetical protein
VRRYRDARPSRSNSCAVCRSCPTLQVDVAATEREQLTCAQSGIRSRVDQHGFLRVAREQPDAHYAEVLLYAKPPNGVRSKKAWAEAFIGDRWDHVEILMIALERSGMSTTHDGIDLTFSRAWRQLTGGYLDDYLDGREAAEAEVS